MNKPNPRPFEAMSYDQLTAKIHILLDASSLSAHGEQNLAHLLLERSYRDSQKLGNQ